MRQTDITVQAQLRRIKLTPEQKQIRRDKLRKKNGKWSLNSTPKTVTVN